MLDKEVVGKVGEGAGIFAAIAYALTVIFSKRRQASADVGNEADREADRLINILREQRDTLEGKVDTLLITQSEQGVKLDRLAAAFQAYACPNAPTCENRPIDANELLNGGFPT